VAHGRKNARPVHTDPYRVRAVAHGAKNTRHEKRTVRTDRAKSGGLLDTFEAEAAGLVGDLFGAKAGLAAPCQGSRARVA